MTKPHPWRQYPRRWTHNVQIVRFAFPPSPDEQHHAHLVEFDRRLSELLKDMGLAAEPSYVGFYRANADWDNVDKPDACVNYPDRGTSTKDLDNEP